MKHPLYILSIIILTGFSCYGQTSDKDDIEGFNKFLGYEKSDAMNKAIASFDRFLKNNFPNQNNQSDRIKKFLLQLQDSFSSDSTWIFETQTNQKIIEEWETSGLRKEVWLYGFEDYEPKYNIHEMLYSREPDTLYDLGELKIDSIEEIIIPILGVDSVEHAKREKEMEERLKNSLATNTYGEFLYGLAKYAPSDTLIKPYVDLKAVAGDVAPELIIPGLLNHVSDYDEPFIKRIILIETYYLLMKSDAEKNGKK